MRIISQDGKWDLPYDHSMVYRWDNGMYQVKASPIGEPDSDYIMGNYSTPEKAEKAMEMLQQAYTGRYITNTDISQEDFDKTMQEMMKHGFGTVIVRDVGDSRVEFDNLNGYFKFPADEEIEV